MSSLSVVNATAKESSGRRIRGLDAEQRREQRRQALLDAGLELFAAQGYPNTSIEQLCQHAYVGTKAFYETFSSRDECYSALLSRISDDVFGQLAVITQRHADESEEELSRRLLSRFAHAFLDEPSYAIVSFGSGSAITPEADRQRRENRRQAADFIEGLWRQFGDPVGPEQRGIAVGIVGGLFDILADHMSEPASGGDIESVVEQLVSFYAATRRGMSLGRDTSDGGKELS